MIININSIQAVESGLVAIEDRWNLLFLDQLQGTFKYQDTSKGVRKMVINSDFYCQWIPAAMAGRNCEWPKATFQVKKDVLDIIFQ